MKPEEQTPEVKTRLYSLTLNFVRKYQPRLYKQYRGELEDLASDFYCQFLTPKSREKGKEETLLDKFDSSITTLEYLTKIAVQRMLIDRSRSDRYTYLSIDDFIDEYGDVITQTFGLTTETDEESVDCCEFTPDFVETVKLKFSQLSQEAKDAFRKQYSEVRGVLAAQYVALFDMCCPVVTKIEKKISQIELSFNVVIDGLERSARCQQITNKTVCLLIDDEVYNFDRVSGAGRGKDYRSWHLTIDALDEVKKYEIYKSGYSRQEFVHRYLGLEIL